MEEYKFIHLLYVPTMACNMACKYCYLEDNTVELKTDRGPLETLRYTIEKLKAEKVIPFNISLHGGEVTTLSKQDFADLIAYIAAYYEENRELLIEHGFKVGKPHIKTNLFDLKKHMDTIEKYQVSISGSLDLPLRLHEQYRVTKGGEGTLKQILSNVALLQNLPNKKKVSATIFREHIAYLDEIIEDIRYLDQNTCLDMNEFNFMIGFAYNSNGLLNALSQEEQVQLFDRMHEAFDGSNLDTGVNHAWFDEFGPTYCTNCDNCGEKFFLLERNGDVYSCVRGQKNKDYFYGNVYENSVQEILNTAKNKIFENHNKLPFPEECGSCAYLYLCKTGCPFVKNTYQTNKSYTCKLQKALYKSRNFAPSENPRESAYAYVMAMHPEKVKEYVPEPERLVSVDATLPELIQKDVHLKYIYDPEVFVLMVDGVKYKLQSQILREVRDIIYITPKSSVILYVKEHLLEEECPYPNNNSLYMMCLSGNLIQYGDEGRTKQAHLFTHQIYQGVLQKQESDREGWYRVDLSSVMKEYGPYYAKENPNNLFFTTNALRDYHYTKQKNNAYYHIQAINLPFQNIEFYYLSEELTC